MKESLFGTARAASLDFRSELRRALVEARDHRTPTAEAFRRIIVRMPTTDPLRWLHAQENSDRFFWSGRDQEDVVAGVGRAAVVEHSGKLDYALLRNDLDSVLSLVSSGSRFFGGMRFDDGAPTDASWRSFPTYRFVMPRFELRNVEGTMLAACNVGPRDDYDMVLDELDALRDPLPEPPDLPELLDRTDHPEEVDWTHAIEWALSAFSSTSLAKVVLGRRARLSFDGSLDAINLLSRLRRITPSCYHFVFENGLSSFLGASPEMLFSLAGSSIRSEAVAGTAPRGDTEGADRKFSRRLLLSEKDQREHEYVRQSIKERLSDLTRMLHVDTTASDMKLAQGRHLRSSVDGVLAEGVDAVDLLRALHPTPAVGGHPHEEAMDVIRHLEPFDRGWYAGPVGWIADGSAEFAVAIRSGLCEGATLDLYSGAGIVCGSDPELEWKEIEQKIGDFLRALELEYSN